MKPRDLRESYRVETKKEPIRKAYQQSSDYTVDYIEWLEKQLCTFIKNLTETQG